jgi:hypothetical protein
VSLADKSSTGRPIDPDIRMGRGTGGKARRAEARVIRDRFGDIATLFVWAETHLRMIDN